MIKINRSIIRLGLTIIGMVGVPITSWLSVKGHEKAKNVEDKKEKMKYYIPAVISGVITCGSIGMSHHAGSKEIAALTATATYAITNRNKLQEMAKPLLGEDKIKEVEQASIDSLPDNFLVEHTGKGSTKFLEISSGRMFYSSINDVIQAEKRLNEDLMKGYAVCLNDFYRYLGISQTEAGDRFGWVPLDIPPDKSNKLMYFETVPFYHEMVNDSDGNLIIKIEPFEYPQEGWDIITC